MMQLSKFIIVPTNDVTEDMRAVSKINVISFDNSLTILDYRYEESEYKKPRCYYGYDFMNEEEINNLTQTLDESSPWFCIGSDMKKVIEDL